MRIARGKSSRERTWLKKFPAHWFFVRAFYFLLIASVLDLFPRRSRRYRPAAIQPACELNSPMGHRLSNVKKNFHHV
jgi:hypothetical protein